MTQLHNVNVQSIQPLVSPREFLEQYPITPHLADLVMDGREQVARIIRGDDDRMLMVVGPCSIHDLEAGYAYAQRLKELATELQDQLLVVMRVYFEKPRTTVGWKGLIYDPHLNGSLDIERGLGMAREFLLQVGDLGLLTGIEFVDPITPQYLADLYSWTAIGARTAESQTHRQMSSGLSMPVGFKNGTGGSVQLAVDGVVAAQAQQGFLGVDSDGRASAVVTKGNPNCHIVLRGGSRGPNFDAESVADAVERLEKARVCPRVIIDCSHANCGKDYTKQRIAFNDVMEQRVSGNTNIVGMMLESHLFEGNQPLDEKNPGNLHYGVSITDPCVGWEETVELLTAAHSALSASKKAAAPA